MKPTSAGANIVVPDLGAYADEDVVLKRRYKNYRMISADEHMLEAFEGHKSRNISQTVTKSEEIDI